MSNVLFVPKPAARLERKSFFACTLVLFNVKSSSKKDWEWKADKAAQIFKCKKPESDSGFICFADISMLINQFSLVFLYP